RDEPGGGLPGLPRSVPGAARAQPLQSPPTESDVRDQRPAPGGLTLLDLAQDRQCAIDSLPVPVMHFHLVPSSPSVGTWKAAGAAFGKVPTKKQTIFGYKLHLLVTLGGVILDFVLAPANAHDLTVGQDLLATHRDLVVLG